MYRSLPVITLVLLTAASSSVSVAGSGLSERGLLHRVVLIGEDDRAPLEGEELGFYRQVGMVKTASSSASGFVTGKNCDLLLTNAHVLIRKRSRKPRSKVIKFYPDPRDPKRSARVTLIKTGYDRKVRRRGDQDDWAIGRLDRSMFKSCEQIGVTPYPGLYSPLCDGEIQHVSFHADDWSRRKISRACKVFNSPLYEAFSELGKMSGVIKHNCDTKSGSSGSPLFCAGKDGRVRLIGLNVSEVDYRSGERSYNPTKHYNLAVAVWGEFRTTLAKALKTSAQRAEAVDQF